MAAISGKKAVTTAGTEVALGSGRIDGSLIVKAMEDNTGKMYIGNAGDGTVSSTTGLELGAGDSVVFEYVGDLSTIMVDSSVNGEAVTWCALKVM